MTLSKCIALGALLLSAATRSGAQAARAQHTDQPLHLAQRPRIIRGVHVSAFAAADQGKFSRILRVLDETELNTIVLDVKDHAGIRFSPKRSELSPLVAPSRFAHVDVKAVTREAHRHSVYVIARLGVLRDDRTARLHPEWVAKRANGQVYRGADGHQWVLPEKEVCDINVDIALEALQNGADEVEFDDFRYPDAQLLEKEPDARKANKKRVDALNDCLERARRVVFREHGRLNVTVSPRALVTRGNLRTGENWESLLRNADRLSPVLRNVGRWPTPDPLAVGVTRLFRLTEDGHAAARVIPWLSAPAAADRRSLDRLKQQIAAVYASGINDWLLFSDDSDYAAAGQALEREALPRASAFQPSRVLWMTAQRLGEDSVFDRR